MPIKVKPRNIFIICEGPDNVGKSTLIKNLKDHFNDYTLHTLHYSNVKQDSPEIVQEYSTKLYTEMFDVMLNSTAYNKSGIICDRSHLGEMVYGPIYRGYSGEYVIGIERKFSNIHSIWNNLFLITLYDEPENLIRREDGLSFTTDLEKKKIEIDNFKSAHEKSTIRNKLILNIKDQDALNVKDLVINFIEREK